MQECNGVKSVHRSTRREIDTQTDTNERERPETHAPRHRHHNGRDAPDDFFARTSVYRKSTKPVPNIVSRAFMKSNSQGATGCGEASSATREGEVTSPRMRATSLRQNRKAGVRTTPCGASCSRLRWVWDRDPSRNQTSSGHPSP